MGKPFLSHVVICGIGADSQTVKQEAKSATEILVRGNYTAEWLMSIGIDHFRILPEISGESIKSRNWFSKMFKHLTVELNEEVKLLYVTPISPIYIDLVAEELRLHSGNFEVIPAMDPIMDLLIHQPAGGKGTLQIIDGLKLVGDQYPSINSSNPVLIYLDIAGYDYQKLAELLENVYPLELGINVLCKIPGVTDAWEEIPLNNLALIAHPIAAILIPEYSTDSSLESFMQVIARLRAPGGCPWDRKQTHSSLRPYLLEETYEALEALDKNDLVGLQEELGDLLLQIALHAQIAAENHTFTISEVISGINRKIVSRHPHVFGDISVENEQDVVQNWEKLKELERAVNGKVDSNGLLDGIPAILPALAQSQSIQERAARVGFDWPEIQPVLDKVMEELDEVANAQNHSERVKELGDLLFAVVNLVRWYKVDAESALRQTNLKFRKRFAYIEENARANGQELLKMTLEEMDILWEKAKEFDD